MICSEFQSLIMPFIEGKLGVLKKEEIIEHLLACPKCSEELEIYYIIINCVKELDGEIDFPDNYHREFLKFIQKTEQEIKLYKKRSFRHKTAFSAVVGISVILTGVSFRTEGEEKIEKTQKNREFIENDLDMRFRFRDEHIFYENNLEIEALKTWLEQRRKENER